MAWRNQKVSQSEMRLSLGRDGDNSLENIVLRIGLYCVIAVWTCLAMLGICCVSDMSSGTAYADSNAPPRQQFFQANEQLKIKYAKKFEQIKAERENLETTLGQKEKYIDSLQKSMSAQVIALKLQVDSKIAETILYPVSIFIRRIPGVTETLFILTVINICLYLRYRKRLFFDHYKMRIIFCLVLLVVLFFAPMLVGAAEVSSGYVETQQTKDSYLNKLNEVNSLLSLSVVQRSILKLERSSKRKGEIINLPEIITTNQLLKPLSSVLVGYDSYYYTLAALYQEDGRTGKAVDNVKQLFETSTNIHDNEVLLALRGLHFLIAQQQLDASGSAVQFILPRIESFEEAEILMADLLHVGLDESAQNVVKQAIRISSKTGASPEFIGRLLRNGRKSLARSGIEEAFNLSKGLETDMKLIDLCLVGEFDDLATLGISRAPKRFGSWKDVRDFTAFLLEKNQKETAIRILKEVIEGVSKTRRESLEVLFRLADIAMENHLYEQAIESLEKAYHNLGRNAKDIENWPPRILASEAKLPDEKGKISFATLYGAFQEKLGFLDKAEVAYKQATSWRMDDIFESYALEELHGINDFHYAWNVFYERGLSNNLLGSFDAVYGQIEKSYLKNLEKKIKDNIDTETLKVVNLRQQMADQEKTIDELTSEIDSFWLNAWSYIFRIIAITIIGIGFIGWAIHRSWKYQKQQHEYRTFAFLAKLIESIGWVHMLTIVNIPFGFVNIFVGQGLLIFQSGIGNSENQRVSNLYCGSEVSESVITQEA